MVEYIVAIDVTRVQFPADASGSYTSYMLVLVIVSVRVMFLGFSTPFLSEPMQTYAASEIELTTLGLWDLRAANCAIAA